MYFKGKEQSEEFARGAWSVIDLMAKVQAQEAELASVEEITAARAEEFIEHVARGGDYMRGFVTGMVEMLAFNEAVGGPNLEVWRPLAMDLRYTASAAHPTAGSKLYELDGAGVSVAPDLTVYVWHDYDEHEIDRSAGFLARVQKRGRPISGRRFDALRRIAQVEPREAANG